MGPPPPTESDHPPSRPCRPSRWRTSFAEGLFQPANTPEPEGGSEGQPAPPAGLGRAVDVLLRPRHGRWVMWYGGAGWFLRGELSPGDLGRLPKRTSRGPFKPGAGLRQVHGAAGEGHRGGAKPQSSTCWSGSPEVRDLPGAVPASAPGRDSALREYQLRLTSPAVSRAWSRFDFELRPGPAGWRWPGPSGIGKIHPSPRPAPAPLRPLRRGAWLNRRPADIREYTLALAARADQRGSLQDQQPVSPPAPTTTIAYGAPGSDRGRRSRAAGPSRQPPTTSSRPLPQGYDTPLGERVRDALARPAPADRPFAPRPAVRKAPPPHPGRAPPPAWTRRNERANPRRPWSGWPRVAVPSSSPTTCG